MTQKYVSDVTPSFLEKVFTRFNQEFVASFRIFYFVLSYIESEKIETLRNVIDIGFFGGQF